MPDTGFPRLADGDIRKILNELDIEDAGWFLLDEDDGIRNHIQRVFPDAEISPYRKLALDEKNTERRADEQKCFLLIARVLIETGEITPSRG